MIWDYDTGYSIAKTLQWRMAWIRLGGAPFDPGVWRNKSRRLGVTA